MLKKQTIDEINNMTRELIDCPVCKGTCFEVIREKDKDGIICRNVICKQCGLVMINPRMSEENYKKFYENYYRPHWTDKGYHTTEAYFKKQIREGKMFVHWLEDNGVKVRRKSVLDVGCGAGGVGWAFKIVRECKVLGIDYGKEYVDFGRSKNLDLRVGSYEQVDEKYDIVILSHVLEHSLDPERDLKYISENCVNDGGILIIQCPGILNLKYSAYDFNQDIELPHIFNFSLTTLTNFLRKTGFLIVQGDEGINIIAKNSRIFCDNGGYKSDYKRTKEEIEKAKKFQRYHLIPLFKLKRQVMLAGAHVIRNYMPRRVYYGLRERYLRK